MSKRLWVRMLQIGVTAACLGVVACSMYEADNRFERNAVKDEKARKMAPEFTLKDAAGKQVHLSDFKGKVVLLDFWATWCGPCNIEIPWFKEFERRYKDRGFEVLGVSMDGRPGWATDQSRLWRPSRSTTGCCWATTGRATCMAGWMRFLQRL